MGAVRTDPEQIQARRRDVVKGRKGVQELLAGLAQRRGGPIEVIRPGDRVFFEPGEDHWHGAAPTRFMTHLAMLEVDEQGTSATWGAHVSDEEYGAVPGIEG